jgi:hypothetical protein
MRSSALPRRDSGEGGPTLLDVLAAAVRADYISFLVIDERNNLVEDPLAVEAKEFAVGHTNLSSQELIQEF